MYIVDDIAYAGNPAPTIHVCGVRPLEGQRLWVRFTTGEAKVFDFTPLLSTAAFAPLADERTFHSVYLDYGVVLWNDGEIDIAPEKLYQEGLPVDEEITA